jgi:hypothetical protein
MFGRPLLLLLVLSVSALKAETIDDLRVLHTPLAQEVTFVLNSPIRSRVIAFEAITDESPTARHVGKAYRMGDLLVFRMKNGGCWILGEIHSELSSEHSIQDPLVGGSFRQRTSRIAWKGAKPSFEEIQSGIFQLRFTERAMLDLGNSSCRFTLFKLAP